MKCNYNIDIYIYIHQFYNYTSYIYSGNLKLFIVSFIRHVTLTSVNVVKYRCCCCALLCIDWTIFQLGDSDFHMMFYSTHDVRLDLFIGFLLEMESRLGGESAL